MSNRIRFEDLSDSQKIFKGFLKQMQIDIYFHTNALKLIQSLYVTEKGIFCPRASKPVTNQTILQSMKQKKRFLCSQPTIPLPF